MAKKRTKKKASKRVPRRKQRAQCILCGSLGALTKTECCDNWICDDEHEYVMFSYADNSCSRNHRRYTLCSIHFCEGHTGDWQDCQECREMFETEMYVYFGTNDYNVTKLENPPSFEPTKCGKCGNVIHLAEGGYSRGKNGYRCYDCTAAELPPGFGPLV